MIREARERRYPDSGGVLPRLYKYQAEAEKCAAIASQLISSSLLQLPHFSSQPLRTNSSILNSSSPAGLALTDSTDDEQRKQQVSLSELEQFYDKMCSLSCTIKETASLKVGVRVPMRDSIYI